MTQAAVVATDVARDVGLDVLEADPYPVYAWMRRHRPVAHMAKSDFASSAILRRGQTA